VCIILVQNILINFKTTIGIVVIQWTTNCFRCFKGSCGGVWEKSLTPTSISV